VVVQQAVPWLVERLHRHQHEDLLTTVLRELDDEARGLSQQEAAPWTPPRQLIAVQHNKIRIRIRAVDRGLATVLHNRPGDALHPDASTGPMFADRSMVPISLGIVAACTFLYMLIARPKEHIRAERGWSEGRRSSAGVRMTSRVRHLALT
jgi:hypothetical protein